MSYDHTQRAPLGWIVAGSGIVMLTLAAVLPRPALPGLLFGGGTTVLAGCMFLSLRVRDDGERLRIAFGPLPIFRRTVPYARIRGAQPVRCTWADGWGIHSIRRGRRRGWIYNLWGFDCVELDLGDGVILVGTDEPKRLAAFVERRISRDRP